MKKRRKKPSSSFPFFTHSSYCSSETTNVTAKCKGSGQFGDDVDVDRYISSILLTKLIYTGKNIFTIFFFNSNY